MVWSDLNGESYRAREWAFAEIDAMEFNPTPSCFIRRIATVTSVPDRLQSPGLVAMCHGSGWSQAKPVLVFSGSDGGLRAATVLAAGAGRNALPQVSAELPCIVQNEIRLPASAPPAEADFTESKNPPRTLFDWQLQEEHRDEIASLYYQRRGILWAADLPWPRLAQPERRMLRHLDAAVAGGPRSMAEICEAVSADEEGLSFAGALLIAMVATRESFTRLDAALTGPPAHMAGLTAGLVHAPYSEALEEFVLRSLRHPSAAVQAMALEVAGKRRIEIGTEMGSFLESADADVLRVLPMPAGGLQPLPMVPC